VRNKNQIKERGLNMKKSKSTTKHHIKTADQAKDFILGRMAKVLNDCLNHDIDDSFACEIVHYLTGQILLSRGETAVFEHILNQLVEHNQELFMTDEFKEDDDGTFH
jgi:hypothetical protein